MNVVLFHKAVIAERARVKGPTARANLVEYLDQAPGSYFSPRIQYAKDEITGGRWWNSRFEPEPTLELVRDSIRIHKITGAVYSSDETTVAVVDDEQAQEFRWGSR